MRCLSQDCTHPLGLGERFRRVDGGGRMTSVNLLFRPHSRDYIHRPLADPCEPPCKSVSGGSWFPVARDNLENNIIIPALVRPGQTHTSGRCRLCGGLLLGVPSTRIP